VIPTLIVFGLVFGRWWRSCLIVAAIGWPVVLVLGDVMGFEWTLLGAAALAAVNTLVGVLAHQGILRVVRHLHRRNASPKTG
jgi:hypothetical protein